MQSSRSSLPSQMDGAAVGLEHSRLSAAIGLPARPQGLGPRGGPPIPTAMPSCRLMAPGLRGSSGGPRHKLAWSRDGGDPKSLAHSFYRRAAARLPTLGAVLPCTVTSSFTPPTHHRYLSTYPTYLPQHPARVGKKKGDLFLVVVWKGGGGQPSFTKENCPDPKKISCATPATRTDLDLHCPSLPSSATPLSVFQRLLRIAPKAASSINEFPLLLFTKHSVLLSSFQDG